MILLKKKYIKIVVVIMCLIAFVVGGRLLYLKKQGNFHIITFNKAYRSAQLDEDLLKYRIAEYGIRTVINLRGKKESESWYQDEIKVSSKLDVKHYDIGLSSTNPPSSKKLEKLLAIFKIAEQPVLIHCMAGADRASLASAIWKVVMDGESTEKAKKQFSILYGHMPVGPTQALDRFFERWINQSKIINF